jgi:hypothetical protein
MKSKTLAGVAVLFVLTLVCLGVQAQAEVNLCPAAAPATALAPAGTLVPIFAAPLVAADLASGLIAPAPSLSCSLPTFCTALGTCVCQNQTCSKGICR